MNIFTRRGAGWVAVGVGLATLVWLAVRQPAAAEPSAGPVSALPHLWQWQLNRTPGPVPDPGGELHMVLRTSEESFRSDVGPPRPRTAPLRPGEGEDRSLFTESLASLQPDQLRVAFQLLDLRSIGVRPADDGPPLRLIAGYEFGRAFNQTSARAGGYSLRSATPHPADRWAAGELPLLTLVTFGEDRQYTYTVLLAVRRAAE